MAKVKFDAWEPLLLRSQRRQCDLPKSALKRWVYICLLSCINNVCIYSTLFLSDTNCPTFSLTTHQSGDPAFSQFITFKTSPPTVNLYFPLSFYDLSRSLNFSSCPHLVQWRSPLRTQADSSSTTWILRSPTFLNTCSSDALLSASPSKHPVQRRCLLPTRASSSP